VASIKSSAGIFGRAVHPLLGSETTQDRRRHHKQFKRIGLAKMDENGWMEESLLHDFGNVELSIQ
jgi:hypothetical protein